MKDLWQNRFDEWWAKPDQRQYKQLFNQKASAAGAWEACEKQMAEKWKTKVLVAVNRLCTCGVCDRETGCVACQVFHGLLIDE